MRFRAVAILLFQIKNEIVLTKVAHFSKILPHKLQGPTRSGSNVEHLRSSHENFVVIINDRNLKNAGWSLVARCLFQIYKNPSTGQTQATEMLIKTFFLLSILTLVFLLSVNGQCSCYR
jgi:hypothetical protein